jgi:hypothetical protein
MGCGGSSVAQPSQSQSEKSTKLQAKSSEPVKLVVGDFAIIHDCTNASHLNGELVVCESFNAGLNEWLVKGERFPLSVGMSLGEKFLEKVVDEEDDEETQEGNQGEESSSEEEDESNEAQTLGQSRFNAAYFCKVLRIEAVRHGVVELDFDVHGDGSLGPLQDPLDSTLGGRKADSSSYEICDVNRRIKGTLVFSVDLHGSNAQFRFGSGGYSFVELRVKKQASVRTELGELAPGDAAIIRNCLNARLNGERVVCESYNAALGEWQVKGDKFPLSVGMSLGTQFLEKLEDNVVESNVNCEH